MALNIEEQLLFNYLKIVCVSSYDETEKVYKEILSSAGGSTKSSRSLKAVIGSINNVIQRYDYKIVEGVKEESAEKIYCLIAINTHSIAEKASFYDRLTCELLSKIIEKCMTSDSGFISMTTCLHMEFSVRANKNSIQSSLDRLIKDKWLVCENGNVSLGIRCQLELEVTIKRQYPDYVKYCSLCKSFLMRGKTCPNCECHVHLHCWSKYCMLHNIPTTSTICPVCKEDYNDSSMEAEGLSMDESMSDPPTKKCRISNV